MFFQEQKTNTNFFIFEADNRLRLMTVIRGMPFYCSTGHNSGVPNTWFPHLGLFPNKNKNPWIIKPQKAALPQAVIDYCEKHKDVLSVSLPRFGTLPTLCISASIGGGFWESKEGLEFKKLLHATCDPQLFLTENEINNFQQSLEKKSFEVLSSAIQVNIKLFNMNTIISVNNLLSRLPDDDEIKYFNNDNSLLIKEALKMLLTSELKINEEVFTYLRNLEVNNDIFRYALEKKIFENKQQTKNLFDLIKENTGNVRTITVEQIDQINILNKIENQLSEEFLANDLLNKAEIRQGLRWLKQNNNLSAENITLIARLEPLKLIHLKPNLLCDRAACELLVLLQKNNLLSKKSFRIVYTLFKKGLIEEAKKLFFSQTEPSFLHHKSKHKTINKFVKYLERKKPKEAKLNKRPNI